MLYQAADDCSSILPTANCSGQCTACGLTPFTTFEFAVRYRKYNLDRELYGHYSDVIETASTTTLESS